MYQKYVEERASCSWRGSGKGWHQQEEMVVRKVDRPSQIQACCSSLVWICWPLQAAHLILKLVMFTFTLILSFSVMFLIPWLWVMPLWPLAIVFILVAAAWKAALWLDHQGWRTLLNLLQLPLLGCFLFGIVLVLLPSATAQTLILGRFFAWPFWFSLLLNRR